MFKQVLLLFFIVLGFAPSTLAQVQQMEANSFFAPADTFDQKRFNYSLGVGLATYTGVSIGLWHTWYKQYPQEGFHFFNDLGEWNDVDKVGHVYSGYFQSLLCYEGAKWTGMSDRKAMWTGMICGGLFQTTIEVMDGFSTNWGFSIPDFAANVGGIGAFALQHKYWGEQRIQLKVSSHPVDYPAMEFYDEEGVFISSLQDRVDDLYGATFLERYLKDYNAQTIWASVNVVSFLGKDAKWPRWLNLALGYGAENLYGGFENVWEVDNETISLGPEWERYHQFYLSFDLDFTKVKTKNHFLRGLLKIFNIFKMPAPALELNSRGEFTFHLFR